ncbi:MAG: M15 family metallopeptidase [Brevundimonas sp.]
MSARRRPSRAVGVVTVAAALVVGAGAAWALGGPDTDAPAALDSPTHAQAQPTAPATPPAPTPTPTPTPDPTPTFDLTAHSTTDPTSPWVVANKAHHLDPIDYAPDDLVPFGGEKVRAAVAKDLQAMFDAAADDGVHLVMHSGYRAYSYQKVIFNNMLAVHGRDHAERYSARPGYSEHQTGLAADLSGKSKPSCELQECFGETVEGRWIAKHASEFGFLVRYQAENKATTGYSAEPWHVRWVGRDLAAYMAEHHVTTLEEVFDVTGGATYH